MQGNPIGHKVVPSANQPESWPYLSLRIMISFHIFGCPRKMFLGLMRIFGSSLSRFEARSSDIGILVVQCSEKCLDVQKLGYILRPVFGRKFLRLEILSLELQQFYIPV